MYNIIGEFLSDSGEIRMPNPDWWEEELGWRRVISSWKT